MKDINHSDSMLASLDRLMRQLRRRPQGTRHAARGTYRLLQIISKSPGLSTRELAEVMDIRQASLNEKLLRLETKGIIRRDRDSNDQRVRLVYLEPAAMEHLERSQEIRSKINDSIRTVLTTEEIEQLSFLTEKLAAGLEQIDISTKTDHEEENK